MDYDVLENASGTSAAEVNYNYSKQVEMKMRKLRDVVMFVLFATVLANTALADQFDPIQATNTYLQAFSVDEIANTNGYVDAGYSLMAIEPLLELLIAFLLLHYGLSRKWRDLAERRLKRPFFQAFIYVPIYLLVTTVLMYPLAWYRDFYTEHKFGLATQDFGAWFIEYLQGSAFSLLGLSIFVALLYVILRVSPQRWWMWGAGLVVGFFGVILLISPLYIEPVFNEYRPMDEGPLKQRVLSIARANGMEADDVKQVDASKQDTRVSANVSGIFGTTRIALNDNLLNQASADGVEAVMAHEIGHYVLNHQWKMITYLFIIFAACFGGTHIGFKAIAKRRGEGWGIRGIDDYAGLPLLYAVAAVFMFMATPVMFRIVYVHEYEADLFAINATQNPDAWAEVALMTAGYRKLHPPAWEENWLNHHPSPYVRIFTAMRWKAEQPSVRNERDETTVLSAQSDIEQVLTSFHKAAANADSQAYFNLLTADAVFLGTDATERWEGTAFKIFVEPYFSKGRGWSYTPTEQNISLSEDGDVAFFDELLSNESYGQCRGSGMLRLTSEGWKIAQYNLSIPLPNALAKELVAIIAEHEESKRQEE